MDMTMLNAAYKQLELKHAEIVHALFHRIFELESGWYSGHYHKGENGDWILEAYPIPVIGVKGFCDVEIQFDRISVVTKLKRTTALAYSFEKFSGTSLKHTVLRITFGTSTIPCRPCRN